MLQSIHKSIEPDPLKLIENKQYTYIQESMFVYANKSPTVAN